MQLTLEIIRGTQADDPFAFAEGEQVYVLRSALGGAESATLRWDRELLGELAALRRPGRDPALAQRLGERLRAFLSTTRFAQSEAELIAAVARGERVVVTLRLAAAELFALPWELLSLSGSGLHLGALPGVLLRYAWPDIAAVPPSSAPDSLGRDGGRVLFAWSAAGGAVPVREHFAALQSACAAAQLPFDEESDVVPRVTLSRLGEALARGEAAPELAPTVLHILCHGAARGGSFGLAWDSEDETGHTVIDAAQLRQLLSPYAATLRLVVLMACDSANSGPLGNQLGSVAQALHRAGIAAVVASRYPLSVAGSTLLGDALYQSLLVQPASLETAVLAARTRLLRESMSLDWAALQLYASPEDGDDTRPLSFRPYRGLAAFAPRHSRFFFGRAVERQGGLAALRQLQSDGRPRFLVVTGASGTGKSSVVLAGLVPDLLGTTQRSERDDALARTAADLLRLLPAASSAGFSPPLRSALVTLRQELTQLAAAGLGGAWEWAMMRPGDEPLAALDHALSTRRDESRPFLLVVDQLEELFTHVHHPVTRSAFAKRLWALCQGASGVSCIVTLRVDFLGRCGEVALDDNGLWLDRIAYDGEHRVFIAQPGPDRLAEAIREPAEAVGLHIAPALVQRMVSELAGEPGALPLLSHVLDLLWQERRGRELSEDSYAALGGVAGALEGSADRLYDSLPPEQQELARRLLLRLVGVTAVAGGETRLRVPVTKLQEELASSGPAARDQLSAVLGAFVAARLLVWGDAGGEPVIEVAHEALIRRWSRLQDFLRADRERLLEVRELTQWQAQYD
ncbi:MAG TPA: CHAT domain-containing protein, partial [Pseudomonadota bacterium]|nr:CHAT domain-containing protein [Pseudomonadota bacterium]